MIRISESRAPLRDVAIPSTDARTYGTPATPSFADAMKLRGITDRGSQVDMRKNVRSCLEGLIAAKGHEAFGKLTPQAQQHLSGAIETYRQAGYSEKELDGLRYAVASQLLQKHIG